MRPASKAPRPSKPAPRPRNKDGRARATNTHTDPSTLADLHGACACADWPRFPCVVGTTRRPCLFFARLPGGRATFLYMAKERWPKERPPRCCVFRPSMDEKCVRAGRACRRAFHGATASGRNPLRPPYGPSRPVLTAAQGPQIRFDDGHHGLVRSEIKQFASSSHAHRMCVKWGPSNTASGRRISPKDGPQDAGQFAAGTGMCLRRTPAPARAS